MRETNHPAAPPAETRRPFSTKPDAKTGLRVVERMGGPDKVTWWSSVRFYDVFKGEQLVATHTKKSDAVAHAKGKIVVVPVGGLGAGKGFNVWQGSEVRWCATKFEAVSAVLWR